jgi:hypothetical protein
LLLGLSRILLKLLEFRAAPGCGAAGVSTVGASQLIQTVTEGDATGRIDLAEVKATLKRVPGYGNADVCKDNQSLPEVSLVSTQAIREYLEMLWKQYQSADRKLRSHILNEVVRNLEIHRKSATRLMGRKYAPRSLQGFRGGRRRKYSDRAKRHLERLWRAMGYMWPGRMKAAMKQWLAHDEHPECNDAVRLELLSMSASAIGRFLAKARADLRRRMNKGTVRGVKRFITKVPLRNLGEHPTELGHCEVDCVAHCGGSMSGDFAWTVNLTDIVSGWTECEAIWCKSAKAVRKALERMERRLPFPLRAIYVDNGSEFLNEDVIEEFARKHRPEPILIYRGRPYRKNDQAYIEQKNYTHVRSLMGYGRISWKKSVPHMNSIYRNEWRHLQNYFMPQQKLVEKTRLGSRLVRRMSEAETPYARLLRRLDPRSLVLLREEYETINPFKARNNQRIKVRQLFGYYKHEIEINQWGKMAV